MQKSAKLVHLTFKVRDLQLDIYVLVLGQPDRGRVADTFKKNATESR